MEFCARGVLCSWSWSFQPTAARLGVLIIHVSIHLFGGCGGGLLNINSALSSLSCWCGVSFMLLQTQARRSRSGPDPTNFSTDLKL